MNKRKDVIPNNLKEYRVKARLTQKQVAEKLGVFEERISHWEKGNNAPSIESLAKLCNIYSSTVEHLYNNLFRSN